MFPERKVTQSFDVSRSYPFYILIFMFCCPTTMCSVCQSQKKDDRQWRRVKERHLKPIWRTESLLNQNPPASHPSTSDSIPALLSISNEASGVSMRNSTRDDKGRKTLLAIKMHGTNRSGKGGGEPAKWPRIWVTTREREKEGRRL